MLRKERVAAGAGAHEKVDFDLDLIVFAGVVCVVEVPLAQCVFIDAILRLVPEP
jgi:hypothetical protein